MGTYTSLAWDPAQDPGWFSARAPGGASGRYPARCLAAAWGGRFAVLEGLFSGPSVW